MFPLRREHITCGDTTIGNLLDKFVLPGFQRHKNDVHATELYNSIKQYYETYQDILFPGSISIGVYDQNKEFVVFDGQHRIHALQKLRTEYPIDSIKIRTDIYHVNTEDEMFQLYHIINQSKPVQLFRGIHESTCAPQFETWFKARFDAYWKDSKRPILLNINGTDMMKRMNAVGLFSIPISTLLAACEKLLDFYSIQTDEQWLVWGITMNTKYKTLVSKDKFYFGLYRCYEWIPRLMNTTLDHSCSELMRKRERENLPKKKKMEIWNKRFDGLMNGTCFCCNETLSYQKGYHCGHIVSVSNGGSDHIDNLEIVCETCNYDMGTLNMNVYKELFSY